MPECSHQLIVHAPLAQTWQFVREMDNWAPLLTGYQGHEKQDDATSVWTLQGDVGMLSRRVQLQVDITEWVDGERVEFTLKGLNEQVDGDGTFTITAAPDDENDESSNAADGAEVVPAASEQLGAWRRFVRWLFATLFRRVHGEEKAIEGPSSSKTQLRFRLRMDAGGPMAPMINAMLQPALLPATEDLATKIANRVHESSQTD